MVPDVVHDVAPICVVPNFSYQGQHMYIVEYIRTTWILQIGENTGTNKFGTTHVQQIRNNTGVINQGQHIIRNYFVDHIDMTNWAQHILESTSGTTQI